MLFTME